MTESKGPAQPEQKGGKTGPVIAIVAIVALIGVGAFVTMSSKDDKMTAGISSEKGEELSGISPAAASEQETAAAKTEESAPDEAAEAKPRLDIKDGNPVVAKVGDTEIKRTDVLEFIARLPEQVRQQMPIQTLFTLARDQIINDRVLEEKSGKSDLSSDPEVEKLAAEAKEQIVRNVYIERQIQEKMTEDRLKKAYQEFKKEFEGVEEVKARHILVESEDKAKEIIARLDKGEDFVILAKESSDGPSAENGGELGWFAKDEMVPEFAEAAFALKKDSVTKEPVQTQFGWHVIKAEDRRARQAPEFEAVKPQLEAQLRQKILGELVEGWQKEAKVEKFDINGEPVDESKSN